MMSKVEHFDEVVLTANELVEVDDTWHVVGEGNDTDTHGVVVDAETERQSAREVHDEVVLRLNAARQVQQQYDI